MRFELPPLEPYALVAYDLNRAIGYGSAMPYIPRRQLRSDNDMVWDYLLRSENPATLIGGSETMMELIPIALAKGVDDIIVLTHQKRVSSDPEHVRFAHSAEEAMSLVKPEHTPVAFGGAKAYESLLPFMKWVVATEVKYAFSPVDKFFPPLPLSEWHEAERRPMARGPHDDFDADFVLYGRDAGV